MNDMPRYKTEENTPQAVVAAYKAAVRGSGGEPDAAFEAAVRAYRLRYPTAPVQTARRQVAEIICFGGTYRS